LVERDDKNLICIVTGCKILSDIEAVFSVDGKNWHRSNMPSDWQQWTQIQPQGGGRDGSTLRSHAVTALISTSDLRRWNRNNRYR